jgi:hypothetical protein
VGAAEKDVARQALEISLLMAFVAEEEIGGRIEAWYADISSKVQAAWA